MDKPRERRIKKLFAAFDFRFIHRFVIMPLNDLQKRILRLDGLDHYFACYFLARRSFNEGRFSTSTTTHLLH